MHIHSNLYDEIQEAMTSSGITYNDFSSLTEGTSLSGTYTINTSPNTFGVSGMRPAPIGKEIIEDAVKELFDEFICGIKDEKVNTVDFYNMYSDLMTRHKELSVKTEVLENAIAHSQVLIDECQSIINKLQESINLLGFEKLLLEN